MPLARVLALADPYPNLRQEIRLALITAGTSKADITCSSDQLDTGWGPLARSAIGPYRCRIGARTVVITTTPVFIDQAGRRFGRADRQRAAKAVRVVETRLTWRWTS